MSTLKKVLGQGYVHLQKDGVDALLEKVRLLRSDGPDRLLVCIQYMSDLHTHKATPIECLDSGQAAAQKRNAGLWL